MRKTFFKNLFRDIKKTLSRFLSIVIIIAVGVSFYAGVRATSPDMKRSGDYYFSKNNLMDFKLVSTLGLTKDDVNEAKKIKGVKDVEGSYSVDAVMEKDKDALVLNINSLPSENGINKIKIVNGRTAHSDNEAVVEDKFLKENKLKIGDTIMLQSGNESDIKDNLKINEFKIVGTAKSPIYVSAQRQLSSVGNGSVRGFVYILPEVFKSDVYTEVYVKTNNKNTDDSLLNNDAYRNETTTIEKQLKDLGAKRGQIRYEDLIKTGSDKITDAENKLNEAKKQATDKFQDGYKQLDDGRNKISAGKLEIEKNQKLLNDKISDGEKQIADGKNKLQAGENEIDAKAVEIQNGSKQISDGEKQLDASQNQLNSGKASAALGIVASMNEKIQAAKNQLEADPNNPVYLAQYNQLNNVYEKDINGKDFDSMYNALKQDNLSGQFGVDSIKSNFDAASQSINLGKQEISEKEKELQDGSAQLQAAREEIELNKKKIQDSQAQLDAGKRDGQLKLDEAQKQLQASQNIIDENTQKLKDEETKANKQFSDGEEEIQKNKDKINDLKKPEFYVLDRSTNVGYESYRQDSDRIDNIGKAFPLIFFLVAALVSLTTMTRMVQENRIEIGTFKALGYSRLAIVAHYLIYSLAASLIGSIIGISFGFKLFPPLIMNAYSSLYAIPNSITPFNGTLALESSIIAMLFTTLAAVGASLGELREVPASLMRPKPPKSGKVILLERITFVWRKLSFTQKVTARNIFRYKQRFFMTVIGIAACTGLMITGFGLKGGIVGATENQFNKIYRYNMNATLTKNIDDDSKNSIKNEVMKDSNIKSVLFSYSKNGSIKKEDSSSEDVYLVIPENKNEVNKYINLTMNNKDLKLNDDGVIITEKLSKLINKKVGDSIKITIDDKILTVKITAITEHYIEHYIYMSPKYYEKITGKKVEYNGLYGVLKNVSTNAENNTSKTLMKISGIGSVSFKNNIRMDYNKSMNSINSVVLILIAAAGVLAFVVIYNLTNININERKRELATIKLLGFYNNELALYIYRENIILTVVGALTGIILGILIDNFVISTAETDVMMFLRTINPIYFIYSVLLTITFSICVNLAMYRRFDKIEMIESLKNAE
jgi:putative ABC transport system permease protein